MHYEILIKVCMLPEAMTSLLKNEYVLKLSCQFKFQLGEKGVIECFNLLQ